MRLMHNDYLEYDGKRYRVECNFNAVTEFLSAEGKDTFDGLAGIGHLKPSDLAPLMAAAINEGERLDGRESKLTGMDVGTWDFGIFSKFMEIYARQSAPAITPSGDVKKKAGTTEAQKSE